VPGDVLACQLDAVEQPIDDHDVQLARFGHADAEHAWAAAEIDAQAAADAGARDGLLGDHRIDLAEQSLQGPFVVFAGVHGKHAGLLPDGRKAMPRPLAAHSKSTFTPYS